MDPERERLELDLIEAIANLAALIEGARDVEQIVAYVDRLSELKVKLVALHITPPASKRATSL